MSEASKPTRMFLVPVLYVLAVLVAWNFSTLAAVLVSGIGGGLIQWIAIRL